MLFYMKDQNVCSLFNIILKTISGVIGDHDNCVLVKNK